MKAITTRFPRMAVNRGVDEIVVDPGWRARLESLGDRKRVIAWSAFLVLLIGGIAVYSRLSAPEPLIAPPAASSSTDERAPEERVFVHVAGAVAKPGLYRFSSSARVADAIEAAGGPTGRADLDAVNLAEVLRDGLKIVVPVRGSVAAATVLASPSPGLVNLNTADQIALETIPGVGPVTATAILQHRTEIGSFETMEQLLDVTGIGPATLEALRPYVTL